MFPAHPAAMRAFDLARRIDMDQVRDDADWHATQAAYGLQMPRNREIYLEECSRLAMQDHPWNPAHWRIAHDRAIIEACYPAELIARWLVDARVSDADPISREMSASIGAACERFRLEHVREGHRYKRGKASGLGREEVRAAVRAASRAALDLSAALRELQTEAHRVGQASTDRGKRVRRLYIGGFQVLIHELIAAGRLEDPAALSVEGLIPEIDVEGDQYVGTEAYWERALLRTGRWYAGVADNSAFWECFPDSHVRSTSSRKTFVCTLADIWKEGVGTRATVTDGDPPSPFISFLQSAMGHLAGLAQARMGHIPVTSESLQAQGLLPIPTARTFRNILRACGN